MNPGMTQLTRTPAWAHSTAAVNVRFGQLGSRGTVVSHAGHAAIVVGADVHDVAAVRVETLVEHFARRQEVARQVVGEHCIPAVQGELREFGGKLPTRRVDESVNTTVRVEDARDELAHVSLIAQFARVTAEHGAAVFDDLVAGAVELFERAAGEHESGTQRGEFMRDAAPEAPSAAGDEDRLAIEQTGTKSGSVGHRHCARVWIGDGRHCTASGRDGHRCAGA